MSVAYLFWKLSSYTMYIVCTTCPSSRSDADLFENCKVVYRSRCHITYSPDSILLSIAFGTENPILYCCNYILLGGYYTYWSNICTFLISDGPYCIFSLLYYPSYYTYCSEKCVPYCSFVLLYCSSYYRYCYQKSAL